MISMQAFLWYVALEVWSQQAKISLNPLSKGGGENLKRKIRRVKKQTSKSSCILCWYRV